MQEITSHNVNELNGELTIEVRDEPGHGGACYEYWIRSDTRDLCCVTFQDEPMDKSEINGISNEALLAIVEHRLQGFQSGEFSCRENAIALTKIQEAMMWLHKRTRDRMARGVEGTNAK